MGSETTKRPPIFCSICDRPITEGVIQADERGSAVHEDCYTRRIVLHSGTRPQSVFRLD